MKSWKNLRNYLINTNRYEISWKQTFGMFAFQKRNTTHTIYTRSNMGQKCEGNCGLWVLNEMTKKIYPENLKKIVGAVWKLPAK